MLIATTDRPPPQTKKLFTMIQNAANWQRLRTGLAVFHFGLDVHHFGGARLVDLGGIDALEAGGRVCQHVEVGGGGWAHGGGARVAVNLGHK